MQRKHRFVPSLADHLEDRVVLSQFRGFSVVVSGLHPKQNVLNRHQQAVVAEVNQAFISFQNDYNQAQATYFALLSNTSTSASAASDANSAIKLYTTQRVNLLAQQLISSFLQYKPGTAQQHGHPSTLATLINHRIVGINGQAGAGSLESYLLSTIPKSATSAQALTLYTLSQDNAIAAAQVSILNGAGILRNGDFGNTSATYQTQNSH
jgi:hypothetical protein